MRRVTIALAGALVLLFTTVASAATVDVRITKSGFSPRTLTVNFGDTVQWRNTDTVNHQVVANNGAFASPIMPPGTTYKFTFRSSGRFPYHDGLKPSNTGTITVKGPPPSLTLGASVPIIVYGASIQLTGVISTHKAGETVNLVAQQYGAAVTGLGTVQTGSGGAFAMTVTPTVFTAYQASWSGATSQQITVQVKPKVTFLPLARRFVTRVTAGRSFAGRHVFLQRRSPFGQWVTMRKLTLGPLSGRVFSIARRRGLGFDTYRVYLTVNQAGLGYLDGASGIQRVRRLVRHR
jgi:plastocyanin